MYRTEGKKSLETDFFYINEITGRNRFAGIYCAATPEACYFESRGGLYALEKTRLWDPKTTLDDAVRISIPTGRIDGLMALGNSLFLVLGGSEKTWVYRYSENAWEPVAPVGVSSNINAWCVSENGQNLFFCERHPKKDAPAVTLFSIGKDMALHPVMPIPDSLRQIHALSQYGTDICISGETEAGGVIVRSTILTKGGKLLPFARVNASEQPLPFYPYKILPSRKHSQLFTQNGASRVFTEEKKIFFADNALRASGNQIAAAAALAGKHEYHVLGSVRRNDEHPSACFYILKNGTQIYKHIDPTSLAETGKWTGYACGDGSFVERNEIFLPCYGSSLLAIRRLENLDNAVDRARISGASVLYSDESTCVFGQMASCKKLQSIKEKPSPKDSRPQYFGGYFMPPPLAEPSRIYLTFDVEQKVPGKPYCLTGEGLEKECGVYWIMDQLENHGLRGVFFVNIYEHTTFAEPVIERIIKDIDARGHEVGLHHHVNNPELGPENLPFNKILQDCNRDEQRTILAYGRDFISNLLGKPPVSFRAGSFRMNDDTLEILDELGFCIDSSMFMGQIFSNITYKTKNRPAWYGRLLELPVTAHSLFNRGSGQYRFSPIDINWHRSAAEMRHIIQSCREHGLNDLVILGHSFSFIQFTMDKSRSPYEFTFTKQRYISGAREDLMNEFSLLLKNITEDANYSVHLMRDALTAKNIGDSRDVIPVNISSAVESNLCPVCESKDIEFMPKGTRKHAQCPVCQSVERIRFKYLYLKEAVGIENRKNFSVLHIGPNLKIRSWLQSLPNLDYISADPFSEADFDFRLEEIPFAAGCFDLIICVGVLFHTLDDYAAAKEMYRVLKPGGELLLWLGGLDRQITKEHYDRSEFSQMVAHTFSTPDNLNEPEVQRVGGKIYYNPRYATRTYGWDFLDKLAEFGFTCRAIRASEFVSRPGLYGIPANAALISCTK